MKPIKPAIELYWFASMVELFPDGGKKPRMGFKEPVTAFQSKEQFVRYCMERAKQYGWRGKNFQLEVIGPVATPNSQIGKRRTIDRVPRFLSNPN